MKSDFKIASLWLHPCNGNFIHVIIHASEILLAALTMLKRGQQEPSDMVNPLSLLYQHVAETWPQAIPRALYTGIHLRNRKEGCVILG